MTEPVVYVVDVCGTLVRDDTTLGLLHQHFASDNQRRARYVLFRALTARRSPLRLTFAFLEKLTGRHLLKHAVVRLLKGDKVVSLDRSAAEYSVLLLKERRVASVWQLLDTILPSESVVLASASLEPVVASLASAIGARHVASTLGQRDGVLTGCYAEDLTGHKEKAMVKKYGPALLDGQVFAISDNFSDRSLLEKASRAYVVVHRDSHRQRWAGLDATFLKVGE
ncbi:MAG: haloacid dehalogenase-like hydrolase [Candidatus Dechloromonas phosphoritropha]|jgi:phosphoserine phosphatase